MDVNEDLSFQWVQEVGNVVHEEVICGLESDLTTHTEEVVESCEEVPVEEIVETIIEDTQQNPDAEILMVPQTSDMESIYIVPQDQGHDYLNIQVTEEVIADNWDRSGPDDGVQIPIANVSHENLLDYDDMDLSVPIEQDSYTLARPYPCEFCNKRFSRKTHLNTHMLEHQNTAELPTESHACHMCFKHFPRKIELMNHLKSHARRQASEEELTEAMILEREEEERNKGRRKKTTTPRKRKSNAVPKRATQEVKLEAGRFMMSKSYDYVEEDVRLVEEMSNEIQAPRWPVTDQTKPYVCQSCGVGFAREKALQSHARIHAGDSAHECPKCGDMFWDVHSMREHVRVKHGETLQTIETDDFDNDATYTGDERFGEFYCETCGVPFHRMDLLKRHRKIHVKEEAHTVDGPEQRHVCTTCGEWFDEALALLAHAESHARSPSRRCLMCGARCRDDEDLVDHVRQSHAEDAPPNMCANCGKTCKDKRSLLKHSWIHNNEKSFVCTKCGKRFHSKARLRRHMQSHRNKMVACDECGEEFPDGRALVSHRHSHNKELAGRTFPCRECGKTFGSRSSQQIHIRIHTGEKPYGCRFCWKAFADGGTLRKHERIHTGEKPYGCAICPRAFNQRVVLREHVRAHHSGPDPKCHGSMTPYSCKVCGNMYTTSEEIVVHIVEHCDANTALRRQPQNGPRKYKRRRKLKPHETGMLSPPQRINESYDMLLAPSDSDDNTKRKLGKKVKQQRMINIEEGYQNVLKSFESSLQNMNSIVSNSKPSGGAKGKLAKKIKKKDEKKSEMPSTSQQPGRPKMIHTQKTRVPVEVGSDGAKKGQKTKTMVTRTPKVMPNEHKLGVFPGGERNRPRTKNVNYHVEGKFQMSAATFAVKPMETPLTKLIQPNVANVKLEPDMQKQLVQNDHSNNNGNILAVRNTRPTRGGKKKPVVTKKKRGEKQVMIKQEPREQELCTEEVLGEEIPNNNNMETVEPPNVFEEVVVDGNDMEVAFEANVTTEETIVPEIAPVKLTKNENHDVEKENHVEMNHPNVVSVHSLMQPADHVPETIIPDSIIEYTCEMCSAIFSSRPELLVHVHSHI